MQGVPISFQTHWRDEGGYMDLDTCIQVHEALEREFGFEVKDKNFLIEDVSQAYHIVTQHHEAL